MFSITFRKVFAIISSNVIFYPFVSLSLSEKSHYLYISTVDFCSRGVLRLFILRLLSLFPTGHFFINLISDLLLLSSAVSNLLLNPSGEFFISVISFDPKIPIWFFFMLFILLWRFPVYLSHCCHVLLSLFKLLEHIYNSWFWNLC